jgi:hypothetical protein
MASVLDLVIPSASASMDALIGVGSGLLMGAGFLAYLFGRPLRKAGADSDILVGVSIVGGVIEAAGGIAFLIGTAGGCSALLHLPLAR